MSRHPRTCSMVLALASALAPGLACRTGAPRAASTPAVERGAVALGAFDVPYVTEGSGRPCVVYALLEYHRQVFSAGFKRELRCTFVQARFAIPEAPSDAPFSIDAAVEDLETVRARLGLSRFVLVGHSIQSVVALAYAKKYPQHATHVIAIGSVPEVSPRYFRLEEEGWAARASADRKAAAAARKAALTEEALARLSPSDALVETIAADAPKRFFDPAFDERPLLSRERFNVPLLMALFTREYRLLGEGEVYRVPVLLAEGRLDWDFGGEAIWGEYRARFADLTVEIFERSGHTPQLEEADAFDARVRAWLASR